MKHLNWRKNIFEKHRQILLFVLFFALVGVIALVMIRAATPTASIQAEDGQLSGGASVVTDSQASAGKYVRFGTAQAISNGCKYSSTVTPAFCETFDMPYTGAKTQTGDLDPVLWGVSRRFIFGSDPYHDAVTVSHNACGGGGTTGNPDTGDTSSHAYGPATPPPGDARICNGIYVSSNNDGAVDVSALDAYPKQPFNFAGRTGTVVFDVTADSAGEHAAWPEFWITDEPVPGFLRCITTCPNTTHAENSIGFSMALDDDNHQTGVDRISMTKGGVYQDISFTTYGTISKGCLAGHSYQCTATKLNHVEVKVSTTRIDIYGTDGGGTTLKHLAGADIPSAGLGFSQGLVWINDVHYNARKESEPCQCGTQYDHSFGWDNLGFDGPKTYRDLGYDVPLNTESFTTPNGESAVSVGYKIGSTKTSWSLPGVTWSQTPTKAKIVFNVYSFDDPNTITASLNGRPGVSKQVNGHPVGVNGNGPSNAFNVWSMSIDLPFSDVVSGTNTLSLQGTSGTTIVGNVSMILVAGAPVP